MRSLVRSLVKGEYNSPEGRTGIPPKVWRILDLLGRVKHGMAVVDSEMWPVEDVMWLRVVLSEIDTVQKEEMEELKRKAGKAGKR